MNKILLLIALVLPLAGCAEFRALKASFVVHAEEAADATLESAMQIVCAGATVGAIERRFTTDEEKDARGKLCP